MTHRRLAALALCAALATPATALAHDPADLHVFGGCGYNSVSQDDTTGPGHYVGVARGDAVVASPRRGHNPVTVSAVRCVYYQDGVAFASFTGTGAGPVAVVPPAPIEFTLEDWSWIVPCIELDVVDGHGVTHHLEECYGVTTLEMPPRAWIELIEFTVTALNEHVFYDVDPWLCAALREAGPGTYGPVTLEPDGDVYFEGEWFWDCPPYDESGSSGG